MVGAVRAGGDRGSDQWQRFFQQRPLSIDTIQELTPNRLESSNSDAYPSPYAPKRGL